MGMPAHTDELQKRRAFWFQIDGSFRARVVAEGYAASTAAIMQVTWQTVEYEYAKGIAAAIAGYCYAWLFDRFADAAMNGYVY